MFYPQEIEKRIHNGSGSQIGKGWFNLVLELDAEIAKLSPDYKILQVKEKFGALRFYVGHIDEGFEDEIFYLINAAETKSKTICDVCGNQGKRLNINGWSATRCEEHAN
jgi:hypothetical protein